MYCQGVYDTLSAIHDLACAKLMIILGNVDPYNIQPSQNQ